MKKHTPLVALTGAIATVSALVACGTGTGTTTSSPSPAVSVSSSAAPSAGGSAGSSSASPGYTAAVVTASEAWLATLTADQQKLAGYAFSDTAAKEKWSNFPAFFKPRTGVAYKDMTAASSKAGDELAAALLSDQGYQQFLDIRHADNQLSTLDKAAGKDGAGFGEGNYYISLFGTPSATDPFMVSFNGHHMSFNVTFGTSAPATSPEFTGVEPASFALDNTTVKPMADEAQAVFTLLPLLPSGAKLGQKFDDIMVGPGKDGQFPTTQSGVKVSSLSAEAQAQVTALITAYVGDVDEAVSGPIIAGYQQRYAKSYVSYSGGTTDAPGAYLRVDGPGVWIEFSRQSSDTTASHYHSVYRDKLHDYGA